MATVDEIQRFLNDFHAKMGVWGIIVRNDRGKNTQGLLDLEITKDQRNQVLRKLVTTDYSQGPIPDTMNNGSDMWVFGKEVKGREVYIKITLGIFGAEVICISFHVAEHPMNYPHKS